YIQRKNVSSFGGTRIKTASTRRQGHVGYRLIIKIGAEPQISFSGRTPETANAFAYLLKQ
ncbi:TPA: hypothetical protein ACHYY3_005140, partial [Escherichia coli]